MPSYRVQRTSEDVLRELSAILREMKDPRVANAMLSIVKLDLASDLTSCKVYISSVKGLEVAKEAEKALKLGSGFVRRELGRRVEMRHTPELHFVADGSIEHSADIARILHRLEEDRDEN
ncbi:MAG: 30S ribosome-binding factor RbfA [Oscillospiraceae bacterium]